MNARPQGPVQSHAQILPEVVASNGRAASRRAFRPNNDAPASQQLEYLMHLPAAAAAAAHHAVSLPHEVWPYFHYHDHQAPLYGPYTYHQHPPEAYHPEEVLLHLQAREAALYSSHHHQLSEAMWYSHHHPQEEAHLHYPHIDGFLRGHGHLQHHDMDPSPAPVPSSVSTISTAPSPVPSSVPSSVPSPAPTPASVPPASLPTMKPPQEEETRNKGNKDPDPYKLTLKGNRSKGNWNKMFGQLVEFKARTGHCIVPKTYPKLGNWVRDQRRRRHTLPPESQARLEDIGFVWKIRNQSTWKDMYEQLVEYKNKHGDCIVPSRSSDYPKLANWVMEQRRHRRKRNMSRERVALLEKLGFTWSIANELWDTMYASLVEYKSIHGNCLVPRSYEQDNQLGDWVHHQRVRKDGLSDSRLQRLEDIGFVWSHRETRWEAMLESLVKFKNENGHCMVPNLYKANPQLGRWVHTQRVRRNSLPEQRRQRLDSVGFVWNIQSRKQGKKDNEVSAQIQEKPETQEDGEKAARTAESLEETDKQISATDTDKAEIVDGPDEQQDFQEDEDTTETADEMDDKILHQTDYI